MPAELSLAKITKAPGERTTDPEASGAGLTHRPMQLQQRRTGASRRFHFKFAVGEGIGQQNYLAAIGSSEH